MTEDSATYNSAHLLPDVPQRFGRGTGLRYIGGECTRADYGEDSDEVETMLYLIGERSVSFDTTNLTWSPSSSLRSGDTVVLCSKSPIILIFQSTSEDNDNNGLKEISDASKGEDEEVDSPSRKCGANL